MRSTETAHFQDATLLKMQAELTHLLPEGRVIKDPNRLELANRATFQTTPQSQLIVQLTSVEEVVKTVVYAAAHKLPTYTISCGLNWGFGSKVPPADVSLLLDLSPMNRILAYDETFGTVQVEPGVTFRQLSQFLQDQGNRHFLNSIGGSPDASVLGNILEKGDGAGPYWNRSEHACSPEIVLADGSLIQLGFGNHPHSQLAHLSLHAPGPNLHGLFFQSNMGIVTKMTIWLHPVPRSFRIFHFAFLAPQALAPALNQLRQLYQRQILSAPVVFWNDYKQVVTAIQYPWEVAGHQTPLDRSVLKRISNNYSAWTAFGGIYHDHEQMSKLVYRELAQAMKPYANKPGYLAMLSTRKVAMFRWLNRFFKPDGFNFSQLIREWDHSPLLGTPTEISLRSMYWRKKMPPPRDIDPNRDGCGVLWNAFEVPFDGERICQAIDMLEDRVLGNGFEPVISFTTVNARYVKVFQQLIFDRSDAAEDQRALACHEAIFHDLETAGLSHTRLDIRTMAAMRGNTSSTVLIKRLKDALDPDGIFSPGRYEF